jgi:hypothetical protein
MPIYYNLDITQGSSFSARLSAKKTDGSAIDITGHKVRGTIKNRFSDSTVLIAFAPEIISSTNGTIDLVLSGSQTASLPVTQAVYDIEMYKTGVDGQDDNSHIVKLLDGRVNVHPEVTTIAI